MKQTAGLEREDRRVSALLTLGELYREFGGAEVALKLIREGRDVPDFTRRVMPMVEATLSSRALGFDFMPDEVKGYSVVRAVQSAIRGERATSGFEHEVHKELEKRVGRASEGMYLPFSVLTHRDFTVGTAAEAGNLTATGPALDRLVDPLRNNLVLARMGATVVSGLRNNVDIPRISGTSTASFQSETGATVQSQPSTALVSLRPKRVGGWVQTTKQAIMQVGGPILETMLRKELTDTVTVQIQDAAINGSGVAPNPRGIRNTAGIGAVAGGANGAQVAWTHVLDLESACANVDSEPGAGVGYVTNPKVRRWTKNTTKGANQPFIWGDGATPLNGNPTGVTRAVASNLTKGTSVGVCSSIVYSSDWSRLLIAIFGAPELIVDPITLAKDGKVRLTLNVYMDVGVLEPAAFAVMDDALTV